MAPGPAAPAAPAAPGNWYDKFSADAFVDAYGALNWNLPKPQAPANPGAGGAIAGAPGAGGSTFRALDVAQGFSVNWAGVNASYAADPIGGTVGLRVGPGAMIYHAASPDSVYGLQFIKQAFATWKAADKLTLDFGKFDQPYGSEVGDSQLNMNYTRSVLWWYMQPLFFTGLRATIPVADQFSILAFAANGWNNSIDNNAGKTFGVQVMVKPADQLTMYLGWVGGPEQVDYAPGTPALPGPPPVPATPASDVPGADSNWRHMIDFVADINPTKDLRFLLNGDYRTESGLGGGAAGTHTESVYGANLVIRYSFTDAFYGSLRGEFYHDEHGDTLGTGVSTNVEDGTLTLAYGVGNHLALMLDNRFDIADNPYFIKGTTDTSKNQFTTTLGVIASTK